MNKAKITWGRRCPPGTQVKEWATFLGTTAVVPKEVILPVFSQGEQMPACKSHQWAGWKCLHQIELWLFGFLFQTHVSISRDSDARNVVAEAWVDVFNLSLPAKSRFEIGIQGEVNENFFLRKWRVREIPVSLDLDFWKPQPSPSPKAFSVPIIFSQAVCRM